MKKNLPPSFLALVWLVVCLHAALPARSASFATIVTNGPATNRINLVLFSEGYTNGQMGSFLSDATNAATVFLSSQPYAEYSNYFNVFAIFTNSAHAGSTHLVPGTIPGAYTNGYTYFNSSYDNYSDFFITLPPNATDASYSHGQGKVDSLLQNYFSSISTNNFMAALLVNDLTPGGSDNSGNAAISSVADTRIVVHESGHVLGNLGDEYTSAYLGYPDVEEPNTTTNTAYSLIKWNAWITTNTPLPTPNSTIYQATVGLFQGAHYHTSGWYRPFANCRMQYYGDAFCPVCQETLVLAIYAKTRPVETRSPATNSLTITLNQMLTFSLALLQPATHSLNVQWRTNFVAIGGATNPVLNLLPAPLGNGTNRVDAIVWDATDLVRKDTKNFLKQTNTWTLNVAVPILMIDSPKWQTNGSFTFRVTGTAPAGVVIQASTNLTQWTPLKTNTLSNGQLFYTNLGAAAIPRRFYRAKTPP